MARKLVQLALCGVQSKARSSSVYSKRIETAR